MLFHAIVELQKAPNTGLVMEFREGIDFFNSITTLTLNICQVCWTLCMLKTHEVCKDFPNNVQPGFAIGKVTLKSLKLCRMV